MGGSAGLSNSKSGDVERRDRVCLWHSVVWQLGRAGSDSIEGFDGNS